MANANAGCNVSLSQFCGLSLSASGLSSPTFRATMLRADGQQHSLRCPYLPLRYQNTTIRVHLLEQDAPCLKSSRAPWNSSHICGHIPNTYQVQTKAHFQTAMIWMLLLALVPGSTVSQHKTKGELLRLAHTAFSSRDSDCGCITTSHQSCSRSVPKAWWMTPESPCGSCNSLRASDLANLRKA